MKNLTAQSLRSNLGSNLREGLKSLSDPVDDYGRHFVYDDEPEVKSATFEGYPYILIDDYSATTDSKTIDSRSVKHDGEVKIHVFGLRESREDKQNFENVCDAVDYNMVTGFNDQLSDVRIARVQTKSDNRFPGRDEKDQNIVVRELQYSFKTQLRY